MVWYILQAFPEYLLQLRHFALSVDKDIFADHEETSLDELYCHTDQARALKNIINKVCSSFRSCSVASAPTNGALPIEPLCSL